MYLKQRESQLAVIKGIIEDFTELFNSQELGKIVEKDVISDYLSPDELYVLRRRLRKKYNLNSCCLCKKWRTFEDAINDCTDEINTTK